MAQWSSWEKKRHPDNPVVFMDVEIQGHNVGRMYFEVKSPRGGPPIARVPHTPPSSSPLLTLRANPCVGGASWETPGGGEQTILPSRETSGSMEERNGHHSCPWRFYLRRERWRRSSRWRQGRARDKGEIPWTGSDSMMRVLAEAFGALAEIFAAETSGWLIWGGGRMQLPCSGC